MSRIIFPGMSKKTIFTTTVKNIQFYISIKTHQIKHTSNQQITQSKQFDKKYIILETT